MFFSLSKIFWLLFQPLTLVLLFLVFGLAVIRFERRRIGLSLIAASLAIIGVGAFTTLGALLLQPLEDRFPRPEVLPQHVDGIVVLGGFMNGEVNAGRQGAELNSAADRIVEAMRLARLFPDAKLVISGGVGAFMVEAAAEAERTRQLLTSLGYSGARFIYENRSRNTVENALFSKELAEPRPGETWLLITSAYHMPRAVGCFEKAGFDVVPWSVDYKTSGKEGFALYLEQPNEALSRFSVAIREWLGLFAYWLTGKTDSLFPSA